MKECLEMFSSPLHPSNTQKTPWCLTRFQWPDSLWKSRIWEDSHSKSIGLRKGKTHSDCGGAPIWIIQRKWWITLVLEPDRWPHSKCGSTTTATFTTIPRFSTWGFQRFPRWRLFVSFTLVPKKAAASPWCHWLLHKWYHEPPWSTPPINQCLDVQLDGSEARINGDG